MKFYFHFFVACFALLSGSVKADPISDCINKYVVVNTYEDIDKIKVTCYSETSNCDVYYADQGQIEGAVLLATLDPDETRLLNTKVLFGARLLSNHQIGVGYESPKFTNTIFQLPRAPDAGTKFAPRFTISRSARQSFTTCAFSALEEAATVTYTVEGNGTELWTIEKYTSTRKKLYFTGNSIKSVWVQSTSPVIISCHQSYYPTFNTWQPISKEPIFTFLWGDYLTISLSDCVTNEPITNFSRVIVESFTELFLNCKGLKSNSPGVYATDMYTGDYCGVLVTPADDRTCVSTTRINYQGLMQGMGLTMSKRSLRVSNLTGLNLISAVVEKDNSCQLHEDQKIPIQFTNYTLGGSMRKRWIEQHAERLDRSTVNIQCKQPAFVYTNVYFFTAIVSLGYQQESLWEPYFKSLGCPVSYSSS